MLYFYFILVFVVLFIGWRVVRKWYITANEEEKVEKLEDELLVLDKREEVIKTKKKVDDKRDHLKIFKEELKKT